MNQLRLGVALGSILLLAACSTGGEPGGGDGPVLLSLSPNASEPYGSPLGVILTGSAFQPGAVVTWNGADRPTEHLSSSQLLVTLPGTDLDQPDTAQVRVRNPDGATSASIPFRVASGAVAFRADSIRPLNGQDASVAEPVTFYFNETLNAASITSSSVTIVANNDTIPATVTYVPARRAIEITAAFAPLTRYYIELAPGIRSTSGGGIATPLATVIFTTMAPMARLSPVSGYVSAAMGSNDRPVLAFMHGDLAGVVAHAAVATCSANCTTSASWNLALSDAGPQAGYLIALALTGTTPSMTWENGSIRYSVGASPSTLIDAGNSDVTWPSIAAFGSRLHVVYYGGGDAKHATCGGNCRVTANWLLSTADQTGNSGAYSDVVADAGGVHAVYLDNEGGDIRYAHCSGNCLAPDWTSTVIDWAGYVGIGADLALAGDGSLHLVYTDQTRGVARYGSCAAACDSTDNWVLTDVTPPGDAVATQAAIAVGATGTLDIVYLQANTGHLYSLTCSNGCDAIANWQRAVLAIEPLSSGFDVSLVVDLAGVRHVLWGMNGVKYMQY